MKLNYLFRAPQYPILCDLEGTVIGALNEQDFIARLSQLDLSALDPDQPYDVVDSGAEGWALMVDEMVLSPLTINKNWTKKQIVQMVNNRKNQHADPAMIYPEASLANKRLDRIVTELVVLLSA